MTPLRNHHLGLALLSVSLATSASAQTAPAQAASTQTAPITLDEYLNTTEINDARLSPDGTAAVISTTSPDWQHDRNRKDLWLWKRGTATTTPTTLVPATQTGNNADPQWSPNGRFIAFVSDRPVPGDAPENPDEPASDKKKSARLWILPIAGGEAFPLYRDPLDVHSFAWSPDGTGLVFSVTEPLSKSAEDAHKKDWKDVVQWRDQNRGDTLLSLPVAAALLTSQQTPQAHTGPKAAPDHPAYPADAKVIAHSKLGIEDIIVSPQGDRIAFETGPVAHRLEDPSDTELFVVPTAGGEPRQLTHNQGAEGRLAWNPTGTTIYFLVRAAGGSIEGPYQDVQGRLYSIDLATGKPTRLATTFPGSWEDLTVTHTGQVLAIGLKSMDRSLYRINGDRFEAIATQPGTYGHLSVSNDGKAMLFSHSGITEPTQIYLAATGEKDPAKLKNLEAITAFNPIFSQRPKPAWQPFQWKSEDGTTVEGVLLYPPGKKGAQHLRMLTLIHGGPADADGDRFGANWYDWAGMAAAQGWLVFRPNYRGSTGYGDAFQLGITPHLVSAPGKDILEGVDALVKQGIADPNHLAIGGYSYGGYMTNWILTQTTRFKAAMTGAGAVEHAANWGFDDLTFDDAWYLSGAPWEKPELYASEAALFQMNKVTTPTHIIGGDADNRVSFFEQIVLERALTRLKVPNALLQFPGENHPLDKNPWHGYIALREELKWLDKYAGS